jgi:hypothetical protein
MTMFKQANESRDWYGQPCATLALRIAEVPG